MKKLIAVIIIATATACTGITAQREYKNKEPEKDALGFICVGVCVMGERGVRAESHSGSSKIEADDERPKDIEL